MDRLRISTLAKHAAVLALCMVLVACGSDDGGDEPAATTAPSDAQPTIAVEDQDVDGSNDGTDGADGATEPANIDISSRNIATPATDRSAPPSPVPVNVSDFATPGASPIAGTVLESTPGVGVPPTDVGSATPQPADAVDEQQEPVEEGDVVDALLESLIDFSEIESTPSPGSIPVDAIATPEGITTSDASVTVTMCDVTDVPAFSGEPAHMLTNDVNFRSGPGTDCDLAYGEPLGEFQMVEIIGGPVVRADEETEWVQIRALGIEGWVAYEFLEPPD